VFPKTAGASSKINGTCRARPYTAPIEIASSATTAHVGGCAERGRGVRGGDSLRGDMLADVFFEFAMEPITQPTKNPEAFWPQGWRVSRKSNRPLRPPLGANNHDAADDAGDDDNRFSEYGKHLKP